MPARKPRDPNAKSRLERITEIVQELDCAGNGKTFEESLGHILRHLPKPEPRKNPNREAE